MKTNLSRLVLMLCLAASAPAACAALQMTSTNNVIVGEIYNDFINTNYYHFINNGTTPVRVVRLIPTCNCIIVSKDADTLQPGEKLKVTVVFDARTIHGKFSRGLWVVTDEPENNQTLLRVSGEVIPLFKGFPEERLNLLAKDKSVALTNHFTFTATTTNYFLGHPQCEELKDCITFKWKSEKIGTTNLWHLTTVIKPDGNMSKITSIRLPVTGLSQTSDCLIRLKLTVGVELAAAPSKLVTTTLTQPLTKKIYITTSMPDAQIESLTWLPQLDGIKVEKSLPKPRRYLMPGRPKQGSESTKPKKSSRSSSPRTRFECTISITPAALQELVQMDEPAITFSYPEHQPVSVPIILYEGKQE